MAANQFSLRTLLIIVTACCCAVGAVRIIGFGPLAATVVVSLGCCILLAPIFAVWSLANHFAPVLTKNATAVALMGFLLGSLLVCGIQHSREQSRRNQCSYHLTKLGQDGAGVCELHPEADSNLSDQRLSQFRELAGTLPY